MFSQSIDENTKRVLEKIAETAIAKDFYLAGGTALAIQLGHRKSIDLDWFSQSDFANGDIKNILSEIGRFKIIAEGAGTIHGELDGVRVTFLHYKYGLLYPLLSFENINLADEKDIAAMKIDAVSSRGSKKDFFDLFFLLEKYSLSDMIGFFEQKFIDIEYNKLHILKSLAYFEDAESDPSPIMLKNVDWNTVKEKISKEALAF